MVDFSKYLNPSPVQKEEDLLSKKDTIIPIGNDKKEEDIDYKSYDRQDIYNEDGKPLLHISQSLIKKYTKIIDEDIKIIERCPHYLYICYIAKTHKSLTNLNMLKGLYFEQLCLGSSAKEGVVNDLPRKSRPKGEKTLDQIRIEEQSLEFKRLCSKYGIGITKDNTQIKYKQLYDHKFKDEVEVYLTGVVDFEHDIYLPKSRVFENCVIDLKLTRSIDTSFGEYSWANPKYMDHIQMDMYGYLSGKPTLYWVFDYSQEKRNDLYIHKSDKNDLDFLHERIRRTIIEIMYDFNMDFPKNGIYESCKDCPLNPRNGGNCKDANNIREIE